MSRAGDLAFLMSLAINNQPGQPEGWVYTPAGLVRVVTICARVAADEVARVEAEARAERDGAGQR